MRKKETLRNKLKGGNLTVLIIEDEIALQKAIQKSLEKHNMETVTCRTAKQGINMLRDLKIDLIWLDHYLLGEEDGLEFLSRIKRNKKWKNIPVFLVSNTATEGKITSYIALGINKNYVKADTRLEVIVKDIKSLIKNQEISEN